MAIIASYDQANADNEVFLGSVWEQFYGQTFLNTGTNIIDNCKFYLAKTGSPTGNATAQIYAITGTFGVDSTPTGSPLAESDVFDVSLLTTSFALSTLTFTGVNQISLVNGTHYALVIKYVGGDASNYVRLSEDTSAPSHEGNPAYQDSEGSGWTGYDTEDLCFYLYSVSTSSKSPSVSPSLSPSLSPSVSPSVSPSPSISPSVSPSPSPSITTVVTRVQQVNDFSQFVVGAGRTGNRYSLLKKGSSYGSSIWRSPVYKIGKNFDVLKIKFAVIGGITGNKEIVPVLYFDHESTTSVGTAINATNYTNSEKLITLSSKNFANSVHGRNDFFLELRVTGSALAVVKLPIEIELEVDET